MTVEDVREVWFVDRYGGYFEDEEATRERFIELLKTIQVYDGDDEHRSISVDDSNGWNLEFLSRVAFVLQRRTRWTRYWSTS